MKTKTIIYQPRKGGAFYSPGLTPGEEITVDAAEAKRLLATGQFEEPKEPKPAKFEPPKIEPLKTKEVK